MLKQRTLRNPIKAVGIGLHTGKNITMEDSGLSKREWNELMSAFDLDKKIVE